jgi:ankyrin repeat protein
VRNATRRALEPGGLAGREGHQADAADAAGETPLVAAARRGDLACVTALFGAGAGVNARSRDGNTALIAAATGR